MVSRKLIPDGAQTQSSSTHSMEVESGYLTKNKETASP